jgi:hypothetical protein
MKRFRKAAHTGGKPPFVGLAVDFFYVLSGLLVTFAYDEIVHGVRFLSAFLKSQICKWPIFRNGICLARLKCDVLKHLGEKNG